MLHIFIAFVFLIVPVISCSAVEASQELLLKNDQIIPGRAALDNYPLIDGHNDFPILLLDNKQNQLHDLDFYNLSEDEDFQCIACKHVDISKLRDGKVGAQFWAAFVECDSQFKDAVELTLEQIDVIKRFVKSYPNVFEFVTTANGILKAFKNNKIGSLIGVEGGHSIASRLSILRTYYELGARYMTLTHKCNTPWVDASPLDTNSINNVTEFGKKIIMEMNRLGMMVDLSHVSYGTMENVIKISKAPVIFSHSNAYTIHPHHRNVRDNILQLLKTNNGIIMVNFFKGFVGQGEVTIKSLARHINYIADICGIQCVGIGSDFGGMESTTEGLEDVSKYPKLFDYLKKSNPIRWTIQNLEKLAGRNFIRVFKAVERMKGSLENEQPHEDWIPKEDLERFPDDTKLCRTVGL